MPTRRSMRDQAHSSFEKVGESPRAKVPAVGVSTKHAHKHDNKT